MHGLTNEFLSDKPLFGDKVDEMMEYLKGAEIIIHNAAFDVPFLNNELKISKNRNYTTIEDNIGNIIDSLAVARKKHPMQKNNLDALCKRYFIRNDHRKFHGALLDSELLADMYLAMTGGQTNLSLQADKAGSKDKIEMDISLLNLRKVEVKNIKAHDNYLVDVLKLTDKTW